MSGQEGAGGTGPSTQIGRLSLRAPVRVGPDASLRHAASVMRREGVSSLVVDTHPVSFLTERDLVHALADGRPATDEVSTVATRSPVWVPPTVTVAHAAALMVGLGFRHLVVVDPSGDVSGVLSMRDAFEVLLREVEADGWLAAFGVTLDDLD